MPDSLKLKNHRFGVVIIGRNEGQRLVKCLASVSDKSSRLVYVDSGSTDGSIDAAQAVGAVVVQLDPAVPFTAARARNAGYEALKRAFPEILFVQFIDGDCEVEVNWLHTATKYMQRNLDAAVVCGRRRERFPETTVYNRLFDREWNTPVGEVEACGGDLMVRCAAFDEVGGFNPSLISGEEPELCVRLRQSGWKIWRIQAEMTMHDAAMFRFSQWWRRNVRSGYGFAEVARMHKASRFGIYSTEIRRAFVWAAVVPALIVTGALVHPVMIVGFGVYALQIVRIAMRQGAFNPDAWSYAFFLVLGKFPEFQGGLTYYVRKVLRRRSTIIEYKAS